MGNVPGKKVLNADAGDADHFGGNDLDDIQDFLNDVDKTGPVKINTEFWVRDDKFKFRDSGNDHNYTHSFGNISANRIINWPALTADDEVLFKTFPATITGKTIDPTTNTIQTKTSTLMTKVGSTYYAIKNDGTIISSSTTAETVLAAAIAAEDNLYFESGIDWTLSAGFTGFTITDNTRIKTDSMTGTFIIVPQGFSGVVFTVGGASGDPVETVSIDGISITEGGTPSKLWTGIKLSATNAGACFAEIFQNIEIYNSLVGIELETTGTGFITNCVFRDITIFSSASTTGILFDEQGDQISENIFQNVNIETNSSAPLGGFRNIDGTGNIFINCKVWDSTAAGTEANILSGASGTTIIGGRMCGGAGHFIDDGVKTCIIDSGSIVNSRFITTPDLAKMGKYDACHLTNADGILNGNLAAIAVGTGANALTTDSTGSYNTFDSGATINSLAGLRLNVRKLTRNNNAYFKTAIYLNSVTNVRVFAGVVASTSAPTSSSDPLNALEGVALWLDSAVSANWKRMHNDTSGASTVDDTTITALTATLYPVEIYAVGDTKFRLVALGQSTDISTNIPATATTLAFWVYIENTTGASRTMRNYYDIVKNDK